MNVIIEDLNEQCTELIAHQCSSFDDLLHYMKNSRGCLSVVISSPEMGQLVQFGDEDGIELAVYITPDQVKMLREIGLQLSGAINALIIPDDRLLELIEQRVYVKFSSESESGYVVEPMHSHIDFHPSLSVEPHYKRGVHISSPYPLTEEVIESSIRGLTDKVQGQLDLAKQAKQKLTTEELAALYATWKG